MSAAGILSALARGPKTVAHLLETTGINSADVSRTCSNLITRGLVKRIDGGGRGVKATYALADNPPAAVTHGAHPVQRVEGARHLPIPASGVLRDPCFKCGVRGDIGCAHQAPARWSLDVAA